MKQNSGSFILIILALVAIGFAVAVIAGIVKGVRNGTAEKKRKEAAEQEKALYKAEQFRKEQEKRKKEEAERLEIEHARDEIRSDFKIYCIGKDAPWTDDFLQDSRIDRAFKQKDQLKVRAYDPRYHVGMVKGTTNNYYLTSAGFCTCEDFRQRHAPCKHMFFLANQVSGKEEGTFIELDYEKGLFGLKGFVFGRFKDGKEQAICRLQERGLITFERQNSDCQLGVVGKSTATKKFEELAASGIPVFAYEDALRVFTSEIRYPDVLNDVT